uniref:WGS project CAEQ00000000 data, annotated contig 2111 n=1 Tax=Trypanosoma congolense (strain IL3000) TaxID=1068625 RepID=F9WBJ0_TRYCI|nr:unnamed protein product [Trypanosoma congolense IL3000]
MPSTRLVCMVVISVLYAHPRASTAWFISPLSNTVPYHKEKDPQQPEEKQQGRHTPPQMDFLRERRSGSHRGVHMTQLWMEAELKGRVSSCWKDALDTLKSGCASLRTDVSARSYLALKMAACDNEREGGRRIWPQCTNEENLRNCMRDLDDAQHLVYVQYKLHTDVLCLFIQEEAFQERTETAVHALRSGSAAAAEALFALRESSGELHSAVNKSAVLQTLNIAETKRLYEHLLDLQKGHAQAFESLQSSAQNMMASIRDTSLGLHKLHRAIDEGAARSVEALKSVAQEAEAFQTRTESHVNGMLHGLERVESFLQSFLDGTLGLSQVVRGVSVMGLIILITTPTRTNGARLPCLSLATVAYAVRPLLLTSAPHGMDATTLFTALFLAEFAVLIYYAYTYCTPEQALRRLLRTEVKYVVDEAWSHQLEDVRFAVNESVAEAFHVFANSQSQPPRLEGDAADDELSVVLNTGKVGRKTLTRGGSRRS